ncbi:MAG: NAD(P)-binding domain-containing protein [Verrucomicrobia bacterium]|nr:NAD(P)-binding domain-containing protein [Verrucomicrobiota bacterium]MCH8527613.1 NAD(P)-binding domain-containing protein [Kiritimatiellia bacterium]
MPPTPPNSELPRHASVIIVGAGPAGIGVALELKKQGVADVILLEAREAGASFRAWPRDTRFLTPSFPANPYGCPDLNSIKPCRSPGGELGCEHPSGTEYADWLDRIVQDTRLHIATPVEVQRVLPHDGGFELLTSRGSWTAQNVVWATGEFFFPNRGTFPGAEHCLHYRDISGWAGLPGERFVLIGGGESGIDAACHLTGLGKTVTVLDPDGAWIPEQGDPSQVLAPQSRCRLREALATGRLILQAGITVRRIEAAHAGYTVHSTAGQVFPTDTRPVLCTGFKGGASQIEDLWDWKNGIVQLTDHDESTRTPGLFLAGPQVRHPGEIFCFIYKFRTRFPVLAHAVKRNVMNGYE